MITCFMNDTDSSQVNQRSPTFQAGVTHQREIYCCCLFGHNLLPLLYVYFIFICKSETVSTYLMGVLSKRKQDKIALLFKLRSANSISK